MDLNDKIKQILADKNISPSIFADEIGIQRSSMSHILAGRNRPSLDIIQKIVKRFPELGTNWILEDEDLPPITPQSDGLHSSEQYSLSNTNTSNAYGRQKSETKASATETRQSGRPTFTSKPEQHARIIDKILIFYSDGTFEEIKQGR